MMFNINKPLITIVTPLYNREKLINETIQSILKQSLKEWEYIIIDDGSTDESVDVVINWSKKDPRIKCIGRNRLPKGAPTCRNIGLANATGKYIVFLDSDDLLKPDCLKRRVEILINNPQMDFIVSSAELFSRIPGDKKIKLNILKKENRNDISRFLTLDFPWQTAGCTYDVKKLKDHCIKWDEKLACHQDLDFAMQVLSKKLYYKKYDELIDLYLRMEGNDKISKHGYSERHIDSKLLYIEKVLIHTGNQAFKYKSEIYFFSLFILKLIIKSNFKNKEEDLIELLKKYKVINHRSKKVRLYYDLFITFSIFPILGSRRIRKNVLAKLIGRTIGKTTSSVNYFKLRTLGRVYITE